MNMMNILFNIITYSRDAFLFLLALGMIMVMVMAVSGSIPQY